MTGPVQGTAQNGLSRLSHAIRRSTALRVAADILPADSTVEDLLSTADTLAEWVRGSAQDAQDGEFLGVDPWR